jgi:hypothetical protein
VVEGDEVVLTDRDGVALFGGSGKKYTATLAPGEGAKRVAGRQTKSPYVAPIDSGVG